MYQKHPRHDPLDFSKLAIDTVRSEVKFNGKLIDVTAQEFKLLHFLSIKPEQTWTRSELIREVWGYEYVGDPRVVDVHIGQLLQKIVIVAGNEEGENDLTGGITPSPRPRLPTPTPISDDIAATPDS